MNPESERSIEEIAETLESGKKNNHKCALFIGAGCSVSANIDAAWKIVGKIEVQYPQAYSRAKKKWKTDTPDYPQTMGELNPIQRNQIIKDEVKKAKVNWAHIAIGLLIQEGYVDRVLTTNFDPLLSRSCALLGEFPAIFDIAGSSKSKIKTERISDKAIFHLHGQYNGFVMVHTDDDFKTCFPAIKQVLDESQKNRTWIVVGYSGENDPIFEHLTKVKEFDCRLHWIGNGDKDPKEHVNKQLLKKVKGTYFTRGEDADSFFIKLTQELGIFPPKFVTKPFTHLKDTFKDIQPFTHSDESEDILSDPREKINKAIEKFEKGEKATQVAEALRLSMAGDNEGLVNYCKKNKLTTHPQLIEPLAWANILLGDALTIQMRAETGEKADNLLARAGEKYQFALNIKPNKLEAFYNWGVALMNLAKTKTGEEADDLLTQAKEKYQEVMKINPGIHQVLNNFGLVLLEQGKTKTGKEAAELFLQSKDRFQRALNIKPDKLEGFFNMACVSALTGDEKGCREWLEKRIIMGPLTEGESMNDSDFDSVRELVWFKKLVAEFKKKKG